MLEPCQQQSSIASETREHHGGIIEKETFTVSDDAAGSIIGSGGLTVATIQNESGASVRLSVSPFHPSQFSDRTVMLAGTQSQILAAQKLIEKTIGKGIAATIQAVEPATANAGADAGKAIQAPSSARQLYRTLSVRSSSIAVGAVANCSGSMLTPSGPDLQVATVRSGAEIGTPKVGEIARGQVVTLLGAPPFIASLLPLLRLVHGCFCTSCVGATSRRLMVDAAAPEELVEPGTRQRRIRIDRNGLAGWVSVATRANEPILEQPPTVELRLLKDKVTRSVCSLRVSARGTNSPAGRTATNSPVMAVLRARPQLVIHATQLITAK